MSKNKSHVTSLSELRKQPKPQYTWIVDGLLRIGRARISLIAAKAETGKSTLARQLAVAVSKGEEFLGRATSRGPVIYWQTEDDAQDVRDSLDKLGHIEGTDRQIYVFDRPPEENTISNLKKEILDKPDVHLVIIETLDDLLRTADGNSNSDWRESFEKFYGALFDSMNKISIVALTQFKKRETEDKGDMILGAMQIRAKSDTKIYLTVDHQSQRRKIEATIRKGQSIPETFLEFDPVTESSQLGQLVADFKRDSYLEEKLQKEKELNESIIQHFNEHPGTPWTKEVRGLFRRAPTTVNDAFNYLVENGSLLHVSGKGVKGDPKLFEAADMMEQLRQIQALSSVH